MVNLQYQTYCCHDHNGTVTDTDTDMFINYLLCSCYDVWNAQVHLENNNQFKEGFSISMFFHYEHHWAKVFILPFDKPKSYKEIQVYISYGEAKKACQTNEA